MHRIAVLSDIHGNIAALEQVVYDLQQRRVDTVVNLGDHLSGPLWPKETVDFLRTREWVHISGNQDEALVHRPPGLHSPSDAYAYKSLSEPDKRWLRGLPASRQVENMLLFHGTPASNTEYLLETVEAGGARQATPAEIRKRLGGKSSSLMLCGHSHIQRVVSLDTSLIVNPGSVGLPAYEDTAPAPHSMESGSPHARYAIVEISSDNCAVQLLAVPYDWQKAARQARSQNRPEWAIALETGFVIQSKHQTEKP